MEAVEKLLDVIRRAVWEELRREYGEQLPNARVIWICLKYGLTPHQLWNSRVERAGDHWELLVKTRRGVYAVPVDSQDALFLKNLRKVYCSLSTLKSGVSKKWRRILDKAGIESRITIKRFIVLEEIVKGESEGYITKEMLKEVLEAVTDLLEK